jgi:hypothetical protein
MSGIESNSGLEGERSARFQDALSCRSKDRGRASQKGLFAALAAGNTDTASQAIRRASGNVGEVTYALTNKNSS